MGIYLKWKILVLQNSSAKFGILIETDSTLK